ncbi:hypothetical protein [Legionella jamestowniensis]|nr:hypothetical protein [Legionella jamestowniensis]SFM02918.1 hypothetical protein SAMN02746073_0012 [Legionella jamestowniensis DSM 19215]
MNYEKPIGRKNTKVLRKKLQEIQRKNQDRKLDNRLKDTFPASDATAKY